MKYLKLLVVFALLSLTSCVMQRYTVVSTSFEYKKYIEKGFYVSELSDTAFEYTPIGSSASTVYSGNYKATKEEKEKLKKESTSLVQTSPYKLATHEAALDALYEECIKVGANGVLKLQFSTSYNNAGVIHSITATGISIKK